MNRLLALVTLATALSSVAQASEARLTRTWQVAADGDTLLTIPVWYVTSDAGPESEINVMWAANTQYQAGMADGTDLNLLSTCRIRAEVSLYDVPRFEVTLDLRKFARPEDIDEGITDVDIINAAIACLQRIVGDMANVPPIGAFTVAVRLPDAESHPSWRALAGRYQRIRVPWK